MGFVMVVVSDGASAEPTAHADVGTWKIRLPDVDAA